MYISLDIIYVGVIMFSRKVIFVSMFVDKMKYSNKVFYDYIFDIFVIFGLCIFIDKVLKFVV